MYPNFYLTFSRHLKTISLLNISLAFVRNNRQTPVRIIRHLWTSPTSIFLSLSPSDLRCRAQLFHLTLDWSRQSQWIRERWAGFGVSWGQRRGNVDLSGSNPIYHHGNNASMNDLDWVREKTKLLFKSPSGPILHFTLPPKKQKGNWL